MGENEASDEKNKSAIIRGLEIQGIVMAGVTAAGSTRATLTATRPSDGSEHGVRATLIPG